MPATNFRRVILSRFMSINSPMRWVGGPLSHLRERVLDILKAFSDFDHGVFALYSYSILAGMSYFFSFRSWRTCLIGVSPCPQGSVRPILLSAIFDVQVGDAGVIGFNI